MKRGRNASPPSTKGAKHSPANRSQKASPPKDAKVATDEYIRSVATASPSDEIAKAKSLLDAGTINQQEYEAIKTRALSA